MKRFCVVTILLCIIISCFSFISFANNEYFEIPYVVNNDVSNYALCFYAKNNGTNKYFNLYLGVLSDVDAFYCCTTSNGDAYYFTNDPARFRVIADYTTGDRYFLNEHNCNTPLTGGGYYTVTYVPSSWSNYTYYAPVFATAEECLEYGRNALDGQVSYIKNPNVDEFIANTLISMGIKFSYYNNALSVAQSAWDYIIDEDNWYIGSGDRNDKDIIWNIDNAVSYANAQSNNYLDWYNGYKVNKDLTVALTKFISDNYIASTLGQGTLAGYNVYYNSQYSYGSTSGTSGFDGTFGSSPNALSFYPASTITYFNGAYLHDNDVIDLDEFVYSPADVRKFIGYPDTSGTIIPPSDNSGSGVITDGNGDTVYNIDIDWPSLDWLADAIQAVLDFLNRLITTIADFLTQILDAILSLFSDAFENLTEFGQGIIEWLYNVIGSLGTLGSNYIPSDLWTIILPFIYLNVGIAILMFVLRSH